MSEPTHPLLDIQNLTIEFPSERHGTPVRAVDDVNLVVGAGETVGLVGESGSGKTTLGRAVLGLTRPDTGRITFGGKAITHANTKQRRALSRYLQVVFQDPYSSLNPARTIGQTLSETLRVHRKLPRPETEERVVRMLEKVGLDRSAFARYPAHFSGGQRQRIAIARALIAEPKMVICDEPVSALDLSVQAQVLNLFRHLQDEFSLSYLFIAHDLAVVRFLSHRIVVLYRGRVMEQGPADTVYRRPLHPYTQALVAAAPVPDPEAQKKRREERRGFTTASAAAPASGPAGCPFSSRCPHVVDICHTTRPPMTIAPDDSFVACHRWSEINNLTAPVTREFATPRAEVA
ncbi:ABC transporter ATP-binding protein [Amycolatopsis sp. K13G38]|uniref:ABC transporter ATP-binding protein n=1 Tax=Amycolatopsis acididurans TaxID=2724524 RepID=A0ABX1J5G8_9PSEU|nr:oligopeptide/dipeptide ABC transporter ATP-binding protein [Amycolatopsis acididurans]NKQ54998.1 ABC transporter ATP-binding protein [Amycolatopsis acididurans]